MKKSLFILSALLLSSLAVSCSSNQTSESSVSLTEPKIAENGKPVVTVGTFGGGDPLFSDTVNKPTDYEIEVIKFGKDIKADYSTQQKAEEYENAILHELDMALISGNIPDILILSTDDMSRMIRQGIMADMYELMEGGGLLSRDDFLPCALEGLDVDGTLPAVMDAYFIYTAVAKTKDVPKEYENWTAADAMSFYEKFKDERDFCKTDSEMALANYMLKVESMNCVDIAGNSCDFSGAFTDLLKFCKDDPVDFISFDPSIMSDEAIEEYNRDQWASGLNDGQLVYDLRIDGFNSMYGQETYGYFNKADLTFVGYPSENGCGAYILPASQMYGITKQSGNKELAWDLVCRMLKHQPKLEQNAIDCTRGVPVLKEQLQRDYDRPESYSLSINNHLPGMNEQNLEGEKMPQEYKDMLYDYILSVPADPYITPYNVQNIIDEEIQPVLLDNRTAEQAAEILQNRIETYISEKYK